MNQIPYASKYMTLTLVNGAKYSVNKEMVDSITELPSTKGKGRSMVQITGEEGPCEVVENHDDIVGRLEEYQRFMMATVG